MTLLDGKVAVVTGAGQGIGAEIARELRAHGARVVIADLNEQAARSVAEELGQTGVACAGTSSHVRRICPATRRKVVLIHRELGDFVSARRSKLRPGVP